MGGTRPGAYWPLAGRELGSLCGRSGFAGGSTASRTSPTGASCTPNSRWPSWAGRPSDSCCGQRCRGAGSG